MSPDLARAKKRFVSTGALAFRKGHRESLHVHETQGQLKWPSDGIASVRTPEGIFVAGRSHAVWIPAGHEHGGVYASDLYEQNVFVQAEASDRLPKRSCLVSVGPRLAQAVAAAVAEGNEYGRRSRAQDLATLRLLEASVVDTGRRPVALGLPDSWRLQPVVDALWVQPGDPRTVKEWASALGIAERTLLRAFHRETGVSFREWRKRARIHRSLQMLLAGNEVARTASQLGYEGTSAFVFAFRATLGTTPARYFDSASDRPSIIRSAPPTRPPPSAPLLDKSDR